MYYCFVAQKYEHEFETRKSRLEIYELSSLFFDCSVYISIKELCQFLGVSVRYLHREKHDCIYIVFCSDSNSFVFAFDRPFEDVGIYAFSPCKLVGVFDLSKNVYKFLLRSIKDSNKTIERFDICVKFFHDVDAGALPASLWRDYCWYRTFGDCIDYSQSDLMTNELPLLMR